MPFIQCLIYQRPTTTTIVYTCTYEKFDFHFRHFAKTIHAAMNLRKRRKNNEKITKKKYQKSVKSVKLHIRIQFVHVWNRVLLVPLYRHVCKCCMDSGKKPTKFVRSFCLTKERKNEMSRRILFSPNISNISVRSSKKLRSNGTLVCTVSVVHTVHRNHFG